MAAPGYAVPNLVQNGNFENSSAINTATYPSSAGGIGQLVQVVNLPNWTRTISKDPGSGGFAFVIDANADKYTSGASYPNQGGGFPSQNSPGANTNIFVWGPNFSPDPQANGFTGSPNGGKFLGIDGDYGRSKIAQTISGLNTSKTYTLSFEYAGSQLTDQSAPTNQFWQVGLNGSTFDLPSWTNPFKGFTAWNTYTTTFTPASTSFDLSFEAFGSAVTGSASLPPFLLLDNVQIFENGGGGGGGGITNEPAPGPLPAAGVAAAFAWSRRLRRRIQG